MATPLEQIAERLRRRVERAAEHELYAPEGERVFGLPRLPYETFKQAMQLKAELAREFEGLSLAECYPTRTVKNEYGRCLEIHHRVTGEGPIGDGAPEACRRALCSELKLLYGVGPRVEAQLKTSGHQTLHDLLDHPRWGGQARALLGELSRQDIKRLKQLIHRWFPVSHPLSLAPLGFVPPKRVVFFDLESLGLFGRPAVLLGAGSPTEGGLTVRQFLARDITEELPALLAFAEVLAEGPALVTYNGRAFDLSFLRERLGYYGVFVEHDPVHFDLLPHARRRFQGLPDARLSTVERHLGLFRTLDLPSALVPDFYHTYLETGNVGPLIPIIEHNKGDLIALAALLRRLAPWRSNGS